MITLAEPRWRERAAAHADRMRRWTGPHRERLGRGEKHPVLDFLFTYYSLRPSRLERWHPGLGVLLTGPGAREFLDRKHYRRSGDGVVVDPAGLAEDRLRTARFVLSLLEATAARAPRLNCFGLHEWAMVYRQSAAELRHAQLPLRLGAAGTDEVLESLTVRCGHYDAFRFFTDAARPRNEFQPTRQAQAALGQPGCLHANMDLYKWAYKLEPFVRSELVGDCFELAVEIRELDMRASPYDLAHLGYPPVPIERPDGRAEYARAQAGFANRAAELRARLAEVCRALVHSSDDSA